ncbi:MAG: hypothetical protein WCK96_19615 [Methylococcales bacterium]
MKYKLRMLVVLFTMISGCSFTQEERVVLKLSSDGKLVSTAEDYEPEEIEDADEPPELEISNPMPLREPTARERSVSEREFPEMQVREMPLRDN